jgi:hypothetical protein
MHSERSEHEEGASERKGKMQRERSEHEGASEASAKERCSASGASTKRRCCKKMLQEMARPMLLARREDAAREAQSHAARAKRR